MARILIVDDEPGIRQFLAGALREHRVVEAATGDDALATLRAEAFDLVITDLRMPGAIDGLALVTHALAAEPELQVIVLSAHGSIETAVAAMKAGAFDFVEKPLASPAAVRLLVERALERRRLLDLAEAATQAAPALPRLSFGDPAMTAVTRQLDKVAPTDATVLLLGESGVGKEVAAAWVHRSSKRRGGPFVAINCATLSESLLESELFGHEKGAFTGAAARKRGRIELAHGGTFFLDEIGELRADVQARLLRVLQERRFERVGGTQAIEVDVRWIAATHRDLRAQIAAGAFREDLYHRLAVFPIRLPALRERRGDIAPLADALLGGIAARAGRALALSAEARALLVAAPWPGNVRELGNVLERAAILADGATLEAEHVLLDVEAAPQTAGTLEDLERDAIARALAEVGGNRRLAAEKLGIGVRTLYEKLRRYRL